MSLLFTIFTVFANLVFFMVQSCLVIIKKVSLNDERCARTCNVLTDMNGAQKIQENLPSLLYRHSQYHIIIWLFAFKCFSCLENDLTCSRNFSLTEKKRKNKNKTLIGAPRETMLFLKNDTALVKLSTYLALAQISKQRHNGYNVDFYVLFYFLCTFNLTRDSK